MFQRKPRRFRRRINGRGHLSHGSHLSHGNGSAQKGLRPNSFASDPIRNKFRNVLSAEKLFEKYTTLAKEAMSSGDKTLSENYLQHADHFIRIVEDRNKNRNQNKFNVAEKTATDDKQQLPSTDLNKDSTSKEKE